MSLDNRLPTFLLKNVMTNGAAMWTLNSMHHPYANVNKVNTIPQMPVKLSRAASIGNPESRFLPLVFLKRNI